MFCDLLFQVYKGSLYGTEVAIKKFYSYEDESIKKYIQREVTSLRYFLKFTLSNPSERTNFGFR
jgi:hypothetical protein